jgi:PhnB protein
MRANAYLNFNGNCKTAFQFYERCLGAKSVMMMTFGDSPIADKVPPEQRDAILHATLSIGDTTVMAADAPPGRYEAPRGFAVALSVADALEAERIFSALSVNGTVTMPIQETFWAVRFGMVTDQFGIPWMINCERPR